MNGSYAPLTRPCWYRHRLHRATTRLTPSPRRVTAPLATLPTVLDSLLASAARLLPSCARLAAGLERLRGTRARLSSRRRRLHRPRGTDRHDPRGLRTTHVVPDPARGRVPFIRGRLTLARVRVPPARVRVPPARVRLHTSGHALSYDRPPHGTPPRPHLRARVRLVSPGASHPSRAFHLQRPERRLTNCQHEFTRCAPEATRRAFRPTTCRIGHPHTACPFTPSPEQRTRGSNQVTHVSARSTT